VNAMAAYESLTRQFREEGYVLFRDVIPSREIAAAREASGRFFANGGTHMFTRDFLRFPPLASLPFRANVMTEIRKVLGDDYATITQFSVTANLHSPIWHRDSQSAGEREYLWDDDYLICKCGAYLQENDHEWGGGMEIFPGSHRPGWLGHRTPFARLNPLGKLARLCQRVARDARDHMIRPLWLPLKAGDVMLFHANLIHRASQPRRTTTVEDGYRVVDPPQDKVKYMIQWETSPNNRYLPIYLSHQASRAGKEGGIYSDSLEARFPADFDPDLVARIRDQGLRVANYVDAIEGARKAA
jgi:hypothetical protein